MAKTFALTAVLITMQDQEPFVTMAFLQGLIKSRQGIKYMVRPLVSCRAFLYTFNSYFFLKCNYKLLHNFPTHK